VESLFTIAGIRSYIRVVRLLPNVKLGFSERWRSSNLQCQAILSVIENSDDEPGMKDGQKSGVGFLDCQNLR
jgi:hypothetical protein